MHSWGGLTVAFGCAWFVGLSLMNEMKKKLSPSLPSISQLQHATKLCPNLVVVSRMIDGTSQRMSCGAGFVFDYQEDGYCLVCGPSYILYEFTPYKERSQKILTKNKINVEWNWRNFEGELTHVDYDLNVFIIRFRNPGAGEMPVAKFPPSTPFSPNLESFVFSLDITHADTYATMKYRVLPDANCGSLCMHVDAGHIFSCHSGVVLNGQLEIVGLKMTRCNKDRTKAHVLLIDNIKHMLSDSSFRFDDTDIRLVPDIQESGWLQSSLYRLKKNTQMAGCLIFKFFGMGRI